MSLVGRLFLIALLLCGCAQANLTNGKNAATYRGVKIFSPTVLSLRSGSCPVPTVDAGGLVTEPPADKTPPTGCDTAVMTVNGVDLKGLIGFVATTILGAMAAS